MNWCSSASDILNINCQQIVRRSFSWKCFEFPFNCGLSWEDTRRIFSYNCFWWKNIYWTPVTCWLRISSASPGRPPDSQHRGGGGGGRRGGTSCPSCELERSECCCQFKEPFIFSISWIMYRNIFSAVKQPRTYLTVLWRMGERGMVIKGYEINPKIIVDI